jgi:hypothetical protein
MSSSRSPKSHNARMVTTITNVSRRRDTEVKDAMLSVSILPNLFKTSKCLHEY